MRGALVWIVTLIASCAPDTGHTAFLCDGNHDCPPGQLCMYGRCLRAVPPDAESVACADAGSCTVGPEQCCLDSAGGTRCGDAGEACRGTSALCDSPRDCPDGDRCCADGNAVFCDRTCDHDACQVDGDCPLSAPSCCHDQGTPWGVCSGLGC